MNVVLLLDGSFAEVVSSDVDFENYEMSCVAVF